MKRRRMTPLSYVIFGLIALGIMYELIVFRSTRLWIAVIVFGAIILLYKFPPNAWRRATTYRSSAKPKPRNRNKFRVIQGSKRDEDEPPRYH